MNIESLILHWGYWIVFCGAMVEGESIILTASALAASGYFDIRIILLVTCSGTLVADQGLYFLGYFFGPPFIQKIKDKLPWTVSYFDKIDHFLNQYHNIYLFLFRFIYGVRIISPVYLATRTDIISCKKFATTNVLAALLWTFLSCGAGYFLIGSLLKEWAWLKAHIWILFLAIFIGLLCIHHLIVFLIRLFKRMKK